MHQINFRNSIADIECEEENFPTIAVPCRGGIYGPSECGKSTFIYNLLKYRDSVFAEKFTRIIYCMPEQTEGSRAAYIASLREICENISIEEGLPDLHNHSLKTNSEPKLLILDDLSSALLRHSDYVQLMTVGSHHHNLSIIYTSQNYYQKSSDGRTFQRQLTMKVMFEDRSDRTVLTNISRQTFGSTTYLHRCFELLKRRCPEENHPYLFIGTYISKNSI